MGTQPLISVGIPTLNGPDRLQRVLESIRAFTRWWHVGHVRLTVCDDGSRLEYLEQNRNVINSHLELQGQVTLSLLTNDARRGIAYTWNRLVRYVPQADVCVLLNDDIEVVHDWLEVLAYSVRENPQLGMVSLNNYPGLTTEYHSKAFNGLARHIAFPTQDYNESRLMDGGGTLLSSGGAAFAFSQEAFKKAGGFDPRYFCFYEEVDFGVTLRKKGYQHYIASHPVIYHQGGATNSSRDNLDATAELAKSRDEFQRKWGMTPKDLRSAFLKDWKRMPVREWNSSLATIGS